MLRVFTDFYRDDLVRVAATITDFLKQKKFMNQIVDNTNYQREVGGRTVAKLDEIDTDLALKWAEAGGVECKAVVA